MLKWIVSSIFAVAVSAVLALVAFSWHTIVHRIPIPGHPDKTVDFVYCRAFAGGELGYVVRYGQSETKMPFVDGTVSVEEIRAHSRVEYHDKTLIVFGPQGQRLEVGGFTP